MYLSTLKVVGTDDVINLAHLNPKRKIKFYASGYECNESTAGLRTRLSELGLGRFGYRIKVQEPLVAGFAGDVDPEELGVEITLKLSKNSVKYLAELV